MPDSSCFGCYETEILITEVNLLTIMLSGQVLHATVVKQHEIAELLDNLWESKFRVSHLPISRTNLVDDLSLNKFFH